MANEIVNRPRVFAVDPGYEQSAIVAWDGQTVSHADIVPNEILLEWLAHFTGYSDDYLVIEQIQSYGMAVGATVFETVFWSGRFAQAWRFSWERLPRREVKLHLCGQARAKDSNIRQALIDRFGPTKELAIGRKATPGPLYGFKSDMWAALAVAVTWHDREILSRD